MKFNKFRKLMATVTISTVLLSSFGTFAFGAGSTAPAKTTPKSTTAAPGGQNGNGFRGRMNFDIKPVLDKLVKAKTITAAQETKIIAYEKKQTAAREAQMKKFASMTQDQRQQYFSKQSQGNKNGQGNGAGGGFQRQNQYADLVKNKTITQKQADAINSAVKAARPKFGNRNFQNNNNGNSGNN